MALLSLLSAAAATVDPIHFADLGIKPYLFRLGWFELRWYSVAYITGIVFAYWHTVKAIRQSGAPMAVRHCDDLFFYCTLGVILGGRLGYATFYTGGNTGIPSLWANPLDMLKLWTGGMSFHGGLIGTALAMAWVAWRAKLNLLRVWDYVAVSVPMGMMLGRLANFVNGELYGREAKGVAWAMVFPEDRLGLARHPSQLYEAGLEGALLLAVMLTLFWKTDARFRPGLLTGAFGVGIGLSRFIVEYFREPDQQLQEFALRSGLSMGQWLSLPIIAIGMVLVVRGLMRPKLGAVAPSA
ncbi:MAG: prolipoprotein diacylglyceryl transferase [Novosphingobium sp.]